MLLCGIDAGTDSNFGKNKCGIRLSSLKSVDRQIRSEMSRRAQWRKTEVPTAVDP